MIENENIPLRKNDRWSLFSLLIRFVTETKPGMNLVQPFKLLEKVVTDIPIQQWEHRDRHLLFTTIFHVLEKITNFKFRTPWLMREAVPSVWNIFGIFIHRDESEENSFQICKFSVDILAPIFVVRGRAFSKCINVLNSHLRKLSPDGIVRIVKNSHFDKYLAEHLETELTLVSNHDLGIIASMFVDTALLSLDEFLVSHYKIRVLHYLLRAASQRSDAEFQCHVLKSVSIIVSLTWTLVAIRKFWNSSCIGIQYVLSLLDSTHENILENAVRLLLTVKTAWEGSKIRDSHLLNRIQDERWSRLFENIPDQAKTIAQVVQQSQQYEGRRRHGNYRILQRMHTRCERREARELVSWFLIDPSLRRFEMEGYLNYSRL
ncbi:hypothetical protein B9Z55_024896 [Caenorhabditis nigoni]|uniref:Uncharacterized protein n=2 Tax=Caenorhabditis nigoni TaxID=1611254 RepID=A0A2G5SWF4_9PELO|nr:hypothetical protein B9Z55_024896 [Caenorhabditis nigoni]